MSHPAVLAVNQLPYAALREHGWDPFVIVPARWRHDYSPDLFPAVRLPELAGRLSPRRVALPGRVQRHVYVTGVSQAIAQVKPAIAFIEAEPTSLPTLQWGAALHRRGIPFAVQADENLARPYPTLARAIRRWSTSTATFAAARSPTAAKLLRDSAQSLPAPVVPHHVPTWGSPPPGLRDRPFTIGYAGRFVPEKGLDDLLKAVSGMRDVQLRLVGNGPLLADLRARAARDSTIEVVTDAVHDKMHRIYAGFDVLVLPSRTTPTWAEQFGRVLVEAMSCHVPVVGSSSGEIPWVVSVTSGGIVFPEGDVDALRRALMTLKTDPELRRRLGASGHEGARARFSVPAVARALSAALRAGLLAPPRRVPTRQAHGAQNPLVSLARCTSSSRDTQ